MELGSAFGFGLSFYFSSVFPEVTHYPLKAGIYLNLHNIMVESLHLSGSVPPLLRRSSSNLNG